jgi:positive regulator of sigma E activity
MEAVARVLAVSDGRARLACQAQSSCKSCASGRGCGLRLLAGGRDAFLEVPDRADSNAMLVPGQVVTVAIRDADILRAAALVYLPALGGLLAGAFVGSGLGGYGDGAVALGGVLGAVSGWALARGTAQRCLPRVTIRLQPGDAGE